MKAAIVLALLLGSVALAAAPAVPTTVSFTARVVDDTTGKALTGAHHVAFELFDAAQGGHSVWVEGRDLDVEEGLIAVNLGETKALDATVFTGAQLFLAVTLDDQAMDDRIPLASVPYAIRAGLANDATTINGMGVDGLQKRITGSCPGGNFVTVINADGTVTCAAGATGTGDITAVTVGSGLIGGGTSGDVAISLLTTCTANQILKWSGTAWLCAADAQGTGDITGVAAGTGLIGGGTTGDVTLSLITSCAMGQLLKWNGAGWGCANDIDTDTDTNSGGTITGVTTSPSSGLVGGGTTGTLALSLPMTCAAGQMLKWSGAAWACANDNDTMGGSGTITGVVAGNGLTGGGTTGSVTVNVVGGTGITVNADNIALDTSATDLLYVKKAGDTLTGDLDMNGRLLLNRGCGPGYVKVGTAFCFETSDVGGLTFTGAAKRCATLGSHMCSSAEERAAMALAVPLTTTVLFDWLDDQDAVGSALYITSTTNAEAPESAHATSSTTSAYSRCCRNVE